MSKPIITIERGHLIDKDAVCVILRTGDGNMSILGQFHPITICAEHAPMSAEYMAETLRDAITDLHDYLRG